MKSRTSKHASFLQQLIPLIAALREIKPHEAHIIHIRANYGQYQIIIGPESSLNGRNRPLEINGEMHHLFISPSCISPNPTTEQIEHHLRDTIVMRDVTVHLLDEHGDGQHLVATNGWQHAVEAQNAINLAGEKGQSLITNAITSGNLPRAAYDIIQQDILQTLERVENSK